MLSYAFICSELLFGPAMCSCGNLVGEVGHGFIATYHENWSLFPDMNGEGVAKAQDVRFNKGWRK